MPNECSYCGEYKLCRKRYGTNTFGDIYTELSSFLPPDNIFWYHWICKDCDDYLKNEYKKKSVKNKKELEKEQKEFIIKRDKVLKKIR